MSNKTSLVRQLIPKSYHFDGYDRLNCPNSRDKPFFGDNVIPMGEHYLTTRMKDQNTISLEYESVCPHGKILFHPYSLSLDNFITKLHAAVQSGSDFITFTIKVGLDVHLSHCKKCRESNSDCIHFLERGNPHSAVIAAVSFNTSEIKEALALYFGITNTKNLPKGGNTMKKKNNFFGMNFELGLSKDPNIASTLMGVAVKNPESGNWYVFDAANNTRKNMANIKMGNFPIFLLPTKKLDVGDLVKLDSKYYYVKSINTNKTITLLGAMDGVLREWIPEENIIPGMTIYTKVVAFDTTSLMDTSSNKSMGSNVLAAMCMMQWANGSTDEFSLDNINDDSFNGLGSCLPVLMAMNGGDLGGIFSNGDGGLNLPMMMMLGSDAGAGDSGQSQMMQMLLLSQLLGGGGDSIFSDIIPTAEPTSVSNADVKVLCEKCGKTYPEGTNFCPACGEATKPVATACPKCGADVMTDAAFCHKCGAKLSPSSCPKCGKPVDGDSNFCPACGNPVNESESKPTASEVKYEVVAEER